MLRIQESILSQGAVLIGYLHEASEEIPNRDVRPAIIFCPGGAYTMLSKREEDSPAFAFFSRGYHVFILRYSIGDKAANLNPLMEASAAVMRLRENAENWGIIPNQIAIAGFSAGGHLAASLGVHWNAPDLKAVLDTKNGANRPDALILCYAVLTGGEYAHSTSFERVSGIIENKNAEDQKSELHFWSLNKHVNSSTPPAFLWHTMDDDVVPVENSIFMTQALHDAGVHCECHLFAHGAHGLSTCNHESNSVNQPCAQWVPLCAAWLSDLFLFRE